MMIVCIFALYFHLFSHHFYTNFSSVTIIESSKLPVFLLILGREMHMFPSTRKTCKKRDVDVDVFVYAVFTSNKTGPQKK